MEVKYVEVVIFINVPFEYLATLRTSDDLVACDVYPSHETFFPKKAFWLPRLPVNQPSDTGPEENLALIIRKILEDIPLLPSP